MRPSQHPATGDRVIVMVSADESLVGRFQFEYICRAVTAAPNDHVHVARDERIEVLEGTLHCRVAGKERVLRAGEELLVPAGTPHALWNEDPSGCRAIGEHRAVAARPAFEPRLVTAALSTIAD